MSINNSNTLLDLEIKLKDWKLELEKMGRENETEIEWFLGVSYSLSRKEIENIIDALEKDIKIFKILGKKDVRGK